MCKLNKDFKLNQSRLNEPDNPKDEERKKIAEELETALKDRIRARAEIKTAEQSIEWAEERINKCLEELAKL